ncbi:MAG: leucine-rich repeat protein [Lachnospiraceae bacterium]|nr:leucine-rich repeat protein [Lachnospiraceae bacterium]
MKRKQLRLMSFVLAATLILSSANAGSGAFASGTDEREEQSYDVAFSGDTLQGSEQISEAAAENKEQAKEQPAEPKEAEQETEQPAESEAAEQEDIAEAAVMTEADEGQQSELPQEDTVAALSETELPEARGVAASDRVNTLITDTTLFNMVLAIYNEETNDSKTASTFTYADLSAYTGALDFSSRTGAANVQNVEGLGLAQNASSINMSSFTKVKEIAAKEFQNCKMTSVSLPPNLEKIGEQTFESCINLAEINAGTKPNTLPTSLKEVGQKAFSSASALKEITLPSFTAGGTILQNATSLFANCSSIEKITIGKDIQTIPASAFTGAGTSTDGVSLVFESGSQLDKILGSAFANMKFTEDRTLDLSNCTKLSSIADSAFKGATDLSTVILPSGLTSLQFGSNTFAKTALTKMYVLGNVQNKVYLPDYVTGIGAGCFFGNTDMKAISLSPNISIIPDYTFDGCTALASIEQRQTSAGQCKVAEIGDCAFRSTAIENTDFLLAMNQLKIIGYQKLSVYGVEKTDDKVLSLDLGGDSADVKVVSATTHEKTQKNKPCGSEVFSNCNSLTSVKLPSSVQQIGSRAFYFKNGENQDKQELKDKITTASIIETVIWNSSATDKNVERKIYPEAFFGNQRLTEVVLPENKGKGETLSIGAYAFCNCKALETIGTAAGKNVFPVTLQEIGVGAFEFCASIPSITICSTETGTCPTLGTKAFQHCVSLASATLPKEITEIPDHFFYNCPIATFSVGTGTAIERFGTLSFMGNQFVNLDLSKYTSLREIGAGAFASADNLDEGSKPWDKLSGLATCGDPQLITATMPAAINNTSNTLYVNSAVFYLQVHFTTMKTPNAGSVGMVYIPDYMIESGSAVFAGTAVFKVIWQADTTGKNQWKSIPPQLFEMCMNIEEAKDVLPTGNYVTQIGKRAFLMSNIQSADLSHYTSLKTIGSGSLPSDSNKQPGVFEYCPNLTSVKLPQSAFVVEEKTFYEATALGTDGGTIDLGGATSLGK